MINVDDPFTIFRNIQALLALIFDPMKGLRKRSKLLREGNVVLVNKNYNAILGVEFFSKTHLIHVIIFCLS